MESAASTGFVERALSALRGMRAEFISFSIPHRGVFVNKVIAFVGS